MANYILGDVMRAEAFVRDKDGNLKHYFSANTLTDSTLNISVTAEEVRGGWGNQLLGKIFHDTNFGVNLTEATWSLDYLAAQIGSQISENATGKYISSVQGTMAAEGVLTVKIDDGKIATLFEDTNAMCPGTNSKIVWVKDCNDDMFTYTVSGDSTYTYALVGTKNPKEGKVCVYYPTSQDGCRQLIVSAAYAPQEFSLFLYGKLFTGNGCQKSQGKAAGKIVIEIPRFQLDGTVDMTMNPSSAATISLNGTALAYGCTCGEDAEPEYAKITTILKPIGE